MNQARRDLLKGLLLFPFVGKIPKPLPPRVQEVVEHIFLGSADHSMVFGGSLFISLHTAKPSSDVSEVNFKDYARVQLTRPVPPMTNKNYHWTPDGLEEDV